MVPIDEAGNSEKWTCTVRGNTHNTFSSFFVIVFALELRVIVASLFVSLHFFSEFHFFFTFIVCVFVPNVQYNTMLRFSNRFLNVFSEIKIKSSLVLSLHFFSAFHFFYTFIICAFVPLVSFTP